MLYHCSIVSFIKKFLFFVYFSLAVLSLDCCVGFSLIGVSQGYSLVGVPGCCTGFSLQWLLLLQRTGSRAHRLE